MKTSGDAMDVTSYVVFANLYKDVARTHHLALSSVTNFWRLLTQGEVRMSTIEAAFRRIEATTHLANENYQSLLARYPKSVKLLRAYARFLLHVKVRGMGKGGVEADVKEGPGSDRDKQWRGIDEEGGALGSLRAPPAHAAPAPFDTERPRHCCPLPVGGG